MSTLTTLIAALGLALVGALVFAPRDGIETTTFIDAPPDLVWSLLTDPQEHQDWSANMHRVAGEFREGGRLSLTMGTPSGGQITFRPRVLVAREGSELRWLGRLFVPRIFDGEHYFRLFPENGGTRLIHGERFRGVLLWAMDVHQFEADFAQSNEGLKARAEEIARQGERLAG